MTPSLLQVVALLAGIVLAVWIVVAAIPRPGPRFALHVGLGLVCAGLLNWGAALVVTQGSVLGVACILGSAALAAFALRSDSTGAA